MRRVRRPLIALVILVVAVLIGYGVRAARSDGAAPASPPGVAVSMTVPAVP